MGWSTSELARLTGTTVNTIRHYHKLGLPYGALGSMMAEMFPDRSRYTAVAVSYNLSGAIGGFAPSVALASVTVFGGTIWATAVLLALSMLVTAAGGILAGRAAHNDALTS